MRRRNLLFLSLISPFIFSPLSKAETYTSSVLYQLAGPIDGSASGQAQTASNGQVVGTGVLNGYEHALLWTASGGVDLHPTNLANLATSFAFATDGSHQVGYGSLTHGEFEHALLWSGSADSTIDLNPISGFDSTRAYGVSGNQQVGYGYGAATHSDDGDHYHALLWNGTASSIVDLHPTNFPAFTDSWAYGTNGTQQVGGASTQIVAAPVHAMLWNGTADSAIDLHPTNLVEFTSSIALHTNGSEQVGYGSNDTNNHALLWFGSGDSAVDLNPAGISDSYAFFTTGAVQVGQGDGMAHMWTGTAESAVNLQNLLPASGVWTDSAAYTVDAAGNIFGIADGTFGDTTGTFAVEWSPVPEPGTGSIALLAGATLLSRRHRRFRRFPNR